MSKMTVLIVEDDIFSQEIFQFKLQSFDVHVVVLENGQEAVEFIKHNNAADLIFMDIHMPVMDGDEATEIIRMHENSNASKRVPIIAAGGSVKESDMEKLLRCGMDDFIEKPVRKEELEKILDKYLFQKSVFIYDIKKVSQSLRIPESLIKKFIKKLTVALIDELKEMQDMYEEKDYAGLHALAHKLKGRFANLQLMEISDLFHTIETAAKKEQEIDYEALIKKISQLHSELKEF